MPTYVYECSSCHDRFEVEQRITENPLETCHCGSTGTVKRIIQPVGVMFKGSGFHINDYSSKSEGKSDSKSEPKADAKTEAPAEAPSTGDASSSVSSKASDS